MRPSRTRRAQRPADVGAGPVAVTGAAAGLGAALAERLAHGGLTVVAVDPEPDLTLTAGGVEHRTVDVRDPLLAERLHGVQTVVHLATSYDAAADPAARRALNVRGTAGVLAAARSAGVRRVVLVTSAAVYGARPDNPVPLPEDAPVAAQPDGGLVDEWLEVERLAGHAVRTGLEVTVLRPASLVGSARGVDYDGSLARSLGSPRLLAFRGSEPLWQLCHVEDLLSALQVAAAGRVIGAAAVACEGWLRQREVEALSGRGRVELPASVAMSTAERLHRLRLTTGSPRELDHLLAPLVVAPERLRAAGWAPAWTNEAAVRAAADQHEPGPGGRPSGAYTAAGATAALVGTAAVVRRVRQRRRGR